MRAHLVFLRIFLYLCLRIFFRRFFIFRDVGMMFSREFAERALDFIVRRRLRNAEGLVIISKLNCHRALNLVRPIGSRNLLSACTTSENS